MKVIAVFTALLAAPAMAQDAACAGWEIGILAYPSHQFEARKVVEALDGAEPSAAVEEARQRAVALLLDLEKRQKEFAALHGKLCR